LHGPNLSLLGARHALPAVGLPCVDVHAREEFRRQSQLADVAAVGVWGFRPDSDPLGLCGLVARVRGAEGRGEAGGAQGVRGV